MGLTPRTVAQRLTIAGLDASQDLVLASKSGAESERLSHTTLWEL